MSYINLKKYGFIAGAYSERFFKITLDQFKEAYPEYLDDLLARGNTGDAIGQDYWFQAWYHEVD